MTHEIDCLQVEEIIAKTATGITEPFLCRLSDDDRYVVKGRGALVRGLLSEICCAKLASALGLPVPDFAIAQTRADLFALNAEAKSSLGVGFGFGSKYMPNVTEIDWNSLKGISATILRRIFVFDYWVKNSDRTGTEWGGNSNLLFDVSEKRLVMIDHNLAFERNFDVDQFNSLHICSKFWFDSSNLLDRVELQQRFAVARDTLADIEEALPEAWLETEPALLDEIRATLDASDTEEFWDRIQP